MVILDQKKVEALLNAIKRQKDRKAVEKLIQEFENEPGESPGDESKKRGLAKKIIDLIIKGGIKIGEHKLIEEFLHLFD